MKKNLLTVLILALLIVNIALTAVMMISVTSTNSKTAALVDTIATVLNLELVTPGEEEEVKVSMADTEVHAVPTMTIPLKVTTDPATGAAGKQVYMVLDMSLLINKTHDDYEAYNPTIALNESMIQDSIRTIISSKTLEECSDHQDVVKNEILRAIQSLYGSDFIYGVAISEVKFG